MLVCFREKQKEILSKGNLNDSISCVPDYRQAGNKETKTKSSQKQHKRKVTGIQKQIKEGTYNIDEKLDAALDRLIEKILQSNS